MLKAVDFFCGAGGMTHGLLRSGIDVVAGLDIHGPCQESYENSDNNKRPCGRAPTFINADVSDCGVGAALRRIGVTPEDDSLVFAGCSPCQYWSKVNTSRENSAESRLLLTHFQRLIAEFRPGYVIVENVSGLQTRRDESGLTSFLQFLLDSGYGFDESMVAVYRYGVPQKRHRYLLLATRLATQGEHPNIALPKPDKSGPGYPEEMALRRFIGEQNGFPALVAGERRSEPPLHWASRLSENNLLRIRATPRDGGDRSSWKDNPELQIGAYRGKDESFRDVYGRMRWDQPASTITTRFNSLSNGRFGHPEEDRAISLREGATLQTFPLTYAFPESFPEAARQIGNAVPPELARRIGGRIVQHYALAAEEN